MGKLRIVDPPIAHNGYGHPEYRCFYCHSLDRVWSIGIDGHMACMADPCQAIVRDQASKARAEWEAQQAQARDTEWNDLRARGWKVGSKVRLPSMPSAWCFATPIDYAGVIASNRRGFPVVKFKQARPFQTASGGIRNRTTDRDWKRYQTD